MVHPCHTEETIIVRPLTVVFLKHILEGCYEPVQNVVLILVGFAAFDNATKLIAYLTVLKCTVLLGGNRL